jgi:hypothetical protein
MTESRRRPTPATDPTPTVGSARSDSTPATGPGPAAAGPPSDSGPVGGLTAEPGAAPEGDLTAEVPEEDERVPMNRRDRRAAARGAPAAKIAGQVGGRPPVPPVRHRDYASRKRG